MCTGRRPPRLGGYRTPNPTEQWVRKTLHQTLDILKDRDPSLAAFCGMAQGTDMIFAEECLSLLIPFTAAIPFDGQEDVWPQPARDRYQSLLSAAAQVVVVDKLKEYAVTNIKAKYILRNKWMLDNADLVLAVWDGSPDGGTANVVKEATKRGMKLVILDPVERTVANGLPNP